MDAIKLRQLLNYDPDTGVFTWRETTRRGWVGKKAGVVNSLGYVRMLINGRPYFAHRLAWLYVNGEWPKHEIDHINHDRADNRIANLRDIPHRVNVLNRRGATAKSKSGIRGVYWKESDRKWIAKIGDNGKDRHLGRFNSPEEASAAYENALREIVGRALPSSIGAAN